MKFFYYSLYIFIILSSCGSMSGSHPENESREPPVEEEKESEGLTMWVDHPEDQSGSYNMDFTIRNFDKGNIRLIGIYGKQNYLADTTRAVGGKFTFEGDQKLNQGMYFVLLPSNKYFQIIIDDDQDFILETEFDNFEKATEVKGSLTNELFYENLAYEWKYRIRLDSVQKKYDALPEGDLNKSYLESVRDKLIADRKAHIAEFQEKYPDNFFTKFKIAGQNPDVDFPNGPDEKANDKKFTYRYRNAFWDNVDFSDRRLLRTPVIHNKLEKYFDELIDKTPDSLVKYADYVTRESLADKEMFKYVANYIGVKYKESTIMGGEAVFVHMIDNFWTPELAYWSTEEEIEGLRKEAVAMKPSLLGKTGQNISCFDPEGNTVSLYDLESEILVLYVYSYECENCRKETPKMLNIYQNWKDKGVDVYALSMDHDKEKWINYIQKGNLTWHNVWDPEYRSGYHRKYHVDITPEIYVLDKDRKIVGKNLKADQLETIFTRIRKESN